jgi:hypothetical protein
MIVRQKSREYFKCQVSVSGSRIVPRKSEKHLTFQYNIHTLQRTSKIYSEHLVLSLIDRKPKIRNGMEFTQSSRSTGIHIIKLSVAK